MEQWRTAPEYASALEKLTMVTMTDRRLQEIASQAARWGADQELNECCKWLPKLPPWSADDLRKHRRPKPPSLKELALGILDVAHHDVLEDDQIATIRRALETLPE